LTLDRPYEASCDEVIGTHGLVAMTPA
jgi:hypothetical protein